MLEWRVVPDPDPNAPVQLQIYFEDTPLPGTVYKLNNVRMVNRFMSDDPNYAFKVAAEAFNDIGDHGCISPVTEKEIAEFLYDHCEDEL